MRAHQAQSNAPNSIAGWFSPPQAAGRKQLLGMLSSNAATVAVAATALALVLLARRRRTRATRFAGFDEEVPESTRLALAKDRWLPLRHEIIRRGVSVELLEKTFDAMVEAFAPQQVDYANTAYGKDHWKLSCFMEYSNGVAAGKVNLEKGAALAKVCEPILADCDAVFLEWHNRRNPLRKGATRTLNRLQSFVTRYRSSPDETHLPRHIDGAAVDGSLVLGLPTYDRFTGGGLTVWDGEGEAEVFELPVAAGDVCLLGPQVWHQSNPVLSGERWVIVIFYAVSTAGNPAYKAIHKSQGWNGPAKENASGDRRRDVRDLLAKRMVDLAKREEPDRMDRAKSKKEKA